MRYTALLSFPEMATADSNFKRSTLRIALAAGEASGDLLASALIRQLKTRLPEGSAYFGIGGAHMVAAGFQAHWQSEQLAVRGYVEALRSLPEILSIRRSFKHLLCAEPPSVFIGIDAPDFNLSLEVALRRAGIPTVHFISPSIWAWRGQRIHKIKRATDLMLCVFPFEAEIYAQAGIAHCYVGHPLADMVPLKPEPRAARRALGLPESGPIIAVLPGSRASEIARIAPLFFAAMTRIYARTRALHFVMPAASPALRCALQRLAECMPQLPLSLIDGQAHCALEACDVALVASGTATLEAALYKKPMVISYQVPWLTAQIMKRQGYLPYIGLPNILAGRFVVPELLQHRATPDALADALLDQLDDEKNRCMLYETFTQLHHTLKRNAAARAADAITDIVHARGKHG